MFDGARVGLQGDLGIIRQYQGLADTIKYGMDAVCTKQAGCAAAKKNRCYWPTLCSGNGRIKILLQCGNIGLLRNGLVAGVGVEVTIGAFLDAPGNMDIQG